MINKIFGFVFLLLIVSCKDNSSINSKIIDNKASRKTSLDTVYLSNYPGVKLYALKEEYNEIVQKRDEFFNDVFICPDSTYLTYLKTGNDIRFESEFGADAYYLWYAYFLQKKHEQKKFKDERFKLIQLYYSLNEVYSIMDQGGSGYAHNIPKIHAYVEWDIYNTYIINKPIENISNTEFLKAKALFTKQNNEVIESVFSSEKWMQRPYHTRKVIKKEVKNLFDKIDVTIVNSFHLNKASDFQKKYSN